MPKLRRSCPLANSYRSTVPSFWARATERPSGEKAPLWIVAGFFGRALVGGVKGPVRWPLPVSQNPSAGKKTKAADGLRSSEKNRTAGGREGVGVGLRLVEVLCSRA